MSLLPTFLQFTISQVDVDLCSRLACIKTSLEFKFDDDCQYGVCGFVIKVTLAALSPEVASKDGVDDGYTLRWVQTVG